MRSRISRPAAAALAVTGLLWGAGTAVAQGDDPPPPGGWEVRTDRGGPGLPDGIAFMEMSPGFHITTGPAAIFYDPSNTASGSYRVEAEIFLFDPGERNEAFGLFVGGRDLAGDGQAYTYFLIRRDGGTLVKRRDGAGTTTVRDWTPNDAVNTWEEREEGATDVLNVLAVASTGDELVFSVNGTEVARVPGAGEHVDGIAGLRINHGLNVHVRSFVVTAG